MEALGFEVMHVYGLTETYGHILQCAWNENWNSFDEDKKNEGDQEKENQPKEGDQEKQQPAQPRQTELSPEQVKSLLEAMSNQEKKVQDKVNAEKVQGTPVRGQKDW